MIVYKVGSFLFMMLAYVELLKACVHAGYFDLYQKNFLMEFAIFLVVFEASLITYYLQYLLYTVVVSRSPATGFICAVVLGLIKVYVYPKLYATSYEILLAYAFRETSMILQFVFYASDRVRINDDQQERFLVVKLVIFHSITFVYKDLMAAKYLEASTMAIPVSVGLLALSDYNEARTTLLEWLYAHRNELMSDFVEDPGENGHGTSGQGGNGHVVQIDQ